jgi:flagellar capping protein FliD
MDTIESLATQINDLDKSLDEKDTAVWNELKILRGLVGTIQSSLEQVIKEVKQTSRVSKDMAFDTKQAVKEINKSIGGDK